MKNSTIQLYNTLTKKKETFKPIKKGYIGMYSCGPTVWNYAHIGNFRTYIFNDLLKRMFEYNDYKVNHIMNITDIDDRIIKVSREESMPFKKFTSKYEKIFFDELKSLNIIPPSSAPKATESIKDIVKLIKKLLDNGCAYRAEDGIYFSIGKSKGYGKLAGLDKIKKTKQRVSTDKYDKDNAKDFALWKFYIEDDGDVFWETELGKGRPGWHIECSAMSIKALGNTIDIHTGATDLIFPHHTNEIAQSECATGKKFVNYWVHAGFLNTKEEKMSKSLGNILTIKSIIDNGYNPLHFRYLCLLTHYRKPLDFTFEHLESAKNAFEKLRRNVIDMRKSITKGKLTNSYQDKFHKAINDDLNMPLAMQVLWEVVKDSELGMHQKLKIIEKFDSILGLGIKEMKEDSVPREIKDLVEKRESARRAKDWVLEDSLRNTIRKKGFEIEDSSEGTKITALLH